MGARLSRETASSCGCMLPGRSNSDPQFDADLGSYNAACRLDPDLQTFDATLQERTSRVMNTLASGVEVRSLSLDSLKEVTSCLLEMNQDVVKIILDCKRDIWSTPDLFDLVEDYFENSLETLEFCAALEKCLRRARDRQLMVQLAVQQFEREAEEGGGTEGRRFSRTLQELKSFRAAGDPFTEEFFTLFRKVQQQQASMLRRLKARKQKLDKRLRTLRMWKRVSSIIFASAMAAVLICSVVAAAITAPPVVTAVAAAAAVPVGTMGKWFDSLWKGYGEAVRRERDVVASMQIGAFIVVKDLESIRVLVSRLEGTVESFLQAADLAIREDEAVRVAIEEIKKKVEVSMETMNDLGRQAERCSKDIIQARTVVLRRIIGDPRS